MNGYDFLKVAARTLGDLVKKLGERVLPEIIPILEEGLKSPLPEKRQGVRRLVRDHGVDLEGHGADLCQLSRPDRSSSTL